MSYTILDITEADYGCEELADDAVLKCCLILDDDGEKIYREIPDELSEELCLVPGQMISEEELSSMMAGNKPHGWDDINHRNIYKTDIGMVCMSTAEYRDYMEMKAKADKRSDT